MNDILQTLIVAGVVVAALLYVASLGKSKDCGDSGCGCKSATHNHDHKPSEKEAPATKQP